LPLQALAVLELTDGLGLTVTVDVFIFVHPADDPVTVYTVVMVGLADMLLVIAPVFQV
jgi:hypothetical protein